MGALAAAPAAPLAPAAALTGAMILLAFTWACLYGLHYGYAYTLGAFVRKLADMVEDIWAVGGTLSNALLSMDRWVRARIGDGLASLENGMARLWDGLAYVVREVGDALVAFGNDTHEAIRGLVYGEIPRAIGLRTNPLYKGLSDARAVDKARANAEAKLRARGIDRLNRDLTREALARERGIDNVGARINTVVMPRIRALDRTLDGLADYTRGALTRRLSRLERLVLGGAISAGALAVLTRNFPWWQCTNVRRFNRALCRAPIGALDDLLGLALTLVASLSIVELARALQPVTEVAAEAVHDWVTED